MNTISVEDRKKIQAHLAEVWKILYANGLEDMEFQRTPNSKQKNHMSEMLIRYNKDHEKLTDGFKIDVGTYSSCWQGIEFEATEDEKAYRKRRDANAEIRLNRWKRKQKRALELKNDHFVAYRYKFHTTPYYTSGNSGIRFYSQNDEGALRYVKGNTSDFVHWLYHCGDVSGNGFSDEEKVKYMKKYGLDKEYDLKTGFKIESATEDSYAPSAEVKKEDKAKQVKDYLRKKFEDDSWKKEALDMAVDPKKTVYVYLDTVREFIRQQEEFDLHGLALYGINDERTKAHERLLEEYGLSEYDEKSDVARDVTKSIDFVGECKIVNGELKTSFYSDYDSALRLAYALEVVIRECR